MPDDNLDIYVPPDLPGIWPETRITTHQAPDFQPAWQPGSNLLAFSSARSGAVDIYLVNAIADAEPVNFTINFTIDQRGAAWSPDGGQLGWISRGNGYPTLYIGHGSEQAALAEAAVISS